VASSTWCYRLARILQLQGVGSATAGGADNRRPAGSSCRALAWPLPAVPALEIARGQLDLVLQAGQLVTRRSPAIAGLLTLSAFRDQLLHALREQILDGLCEVLWAFRYLTAQVLNDPDCQIIVQTHLELVG
jgi:hypothetical protein